MMPCHTLTAPYKRVFVRVHRIFVTTRSITLLPYEYTYVRPESLLQAHPHRLQALAHIAPYKQVFPYIMPLSFLASLLSSTILPIMFPTLQDSQALTSTIWMIILSIIPSDLVRAGAILLGSVICISNITHVARPLVLIEKLQMRLLSLEGKFQDAIESGIMAEADAFFSVKIERRIRGIRYRVFELYERTLSTSGVLQEIKAVWRGHSYEIIECIRNVDTLEREFEISRAMVLKNRYHLWR